MIETHDLVAARWARAARRAPHLAVGKWLLRIALVIIACFGARHLLFLTLWSWRTGERTLVALIALHAAAVLLAMGLPVRLDDGTPGNRLGALLRGYGDRAARLGALGRALLVEVAFWFLYPPAMTVIAGDRLQWPVPFVIAVTSAMIVLPLHRIAVSQRAEASRLSAPEW